MAPPEANLALEQEVIQYIRERFGLANTIKLTAQPLRSFSYPAFEEMPITIDDGKKTQTAPFYLTKDHHYLIVGGLYPLGSDVRSEIVQHFREQSKVPEATKLIVGPLRNSPYPNFLASTVTADYGKQKRSQEIYVTRDNRILVLGSIFHLVEDPRQEALRTMSLQGRPSQGPARAPVTIVEFADLQCPSCAVLHGFLERELLPKYEGKVRLVFKEFPLIGVHDWSLTGAIANECAYNINPASFVPFRTLVFQSQSTLNATNARDLLLNYAEQAGVDRVRVAGCLDAKASLPRIEQDLAEGKRLNVTRVPTFFVNGKMIVGMPAAADFFKEIDDALAGK
jgi:protein-disulfide isomerase